VLPDADAGRILKTAELLLDDPNTHSLLLVLSPARPKVLEETARAVTEKASGYDKPIFACLMGGEAAQPGRALLAAGGIPSFAFPSSATNAIAAAYRFSQWQERPLPVEISYRHDLSKARQVVAEAGKRGLAELSGTQAQALLAAFEMPLPETRLARTSDEALAAAEQTGYPVRLLLDAPGLPPERKGAFTAGALTGETALYEQFLTLTGKASRLYPEIPIHGCLVQAAPAGFTLSLSISFRRDPVFGPLLFLCPGTGAGENCPEEPSICRIAPLSLDDAHDLARSAQKMGAAKTATAAAPAKDEDAYTELEDILLIMSELAMDMPEIIEASCGPVFFSANRALVSDAHFFLNHNPPHPDGAGGAA
jgi:acetyltransferase